MPSASSPSGTAVKATDETLLVDESMDITGKIRLAID